MIVAPWGWGVPGGGFWPVTMSRLWPLFTFTWKPFCRSSCRACWIGWPTTWGTAPWPPSLSLQNGFHHWHWPLVTVSWTGAPLLTC